MLYVVHGVLHLLGHDDGRVDARARMRAAERALLASVGLPSVFEGRRGR
jgi:ssRNA-specific RNase YbeY (16S rRNA maturation enzyme)